MESYIHTYIYIYIKSQKYHKFVVQYNFLQKEKKEIRLQREMADARVGAGQHKMSPRHLFDPEGIYTVEYYSAIKENEIMPLATTRMH